MLKELASGALGVVVPATTHQVREDKPDVAIIIDNQQGVAWYYFVGPQLTLDLSDAAWPSLQRDVRAHAEFLRDEMIRMDEHEPSRHHPLVDCERVIVDGAPALQVIHYMIRRQGSELAMGHLLIPTRAGVFEARAMARNVGTTGLRESMLFSEAFAEDPAVEPEELGLRIAYNDPRHDARFPEHVISRTRLVLAQLRATIRVPQPAAAVPTGPVTLQLGCTVTPPPRFAVHTDNLMIGRFARTSLAVNDGVQFLVVERAPHSADDQMREVISAHGMQVMATQTHGDIVIGDGGSNQLRVAVATSSIGDRTYLATLVTTPLQPLSVVVDELTAVAASIR